jgi:hypothetical protein
VSDGLRQSNRWLVAMCVIPTGNLPARGQRGRRIVARCGRRLAIPFASLRSEWIFSSFRLSGSGSIGISGRALWRAARGNEGATRINPRPIGAEFR